MKVISRVGVAVGAAGLLLLGGALTVGGSEGWAAAPSVGAQITDANHQPIDNGGSQTVFSISLPQGAACSKDTASHQYHVFGFIISASGPYPGSVLWDANGPVLQLNPPDDDTHTLYDTTGSPYVGINTAINTGQVPQAPNFTWSNYSINGSGGTLLTLPAGTYNVGIACVTNKSKTDKFWSVPLTFTASSSDPNGETWTVSGNGSEGAGSTWTSTILGTQPQSEAALGEAVTLTATITCTAPDESTVSCPTSGMGSVNFFDGATSLGTQNVSNGAASLTTSSLTSGTHTLKASFVPADLTKFVPSDSQPTQFTVTGSSTTTTTTTMTGGSTTTTTAPGGSTTTTTTNTGSSSTTTTVGGAGSPSDQSGSGQPTDTSSASDSTTSSSTDSGSSFGSMPTTGAAAASSTVMGCVLIGAGMTAVVLTRRRRVRQHRDGRPIASGGPRSGSRW